MSEVNFDNFDVAVPWDTIPVTDTVEEGRYVLRVKEMKLAESREGKLMAVGYFTIDEGPLKDVPFPIQNYVLGTEDDKHAQDPLTWKRSFGSRQLNLLMEAVGVPKEERSLKATLGRAVGTRFQAYVTKGVQREGEYAGTEQNRITKYVGYGQEMKVPGKPGPVTGPNGAVRGPEVPRSRMRPGAPVEGPGEPQDDLGGL